MTAHDGVRGGATAEKPSLPLGFEELSAIPDPAARIAGVPPSPVPSIDEPSPTRAQRRRSLTLALALAAAWILLVVLGFGPRGDLGHVGVAASLLLWVVTAAAALTLVLLPRARGLPPGVRTVQWIVVVLPAIYLATVLAPHPAPYGIAHDAPLTLACVRPCLGLAGIAALGPLLLAAFALRRSFLSAPAWRGAAVGAVCGMAGAIGIQAHCAVDSPAHVLAAHAPVILLGAAVGAALGAIRGRL